MKTGKSNFGEEQKLGRYFSKMKIGKSIFPMGRAGYER